MRPIDVAQVEELLGRGALLVEVLPREEYEEEHLPGAISIPLKDLDAESVGSLDRDRPIVVYCADAQCDLSPRAAWRLETLGFVEVYDYAPGKADWAASGRPTEGELASDRRIGALAHTDVPTCSLTERVDHVAERTAAAGSDTCVVVNDERVVLGRLFRRDLEAGGSGTA